MWQSHDAAFSPERKQARRFDTPYRSRVITDQVYTEGEKSEGKREKAMTRFRESMRRFYPKENPYHIYFGDLHGHSCLSDGRPTPDEYYPGAGLGSARCRLRKNTGINM